MENIGKQFLNLTKYDAIEDSDQSKGIPQPPLEYTVVPKKEIPLPLPGEAVVTGISLKDALSNRISYRDYSSEGITLSELSYLLWSTQGVKSTRKKGALSATFRTVPSAGARHALETYLVVNNVEGISAGLYKYEAIRHVLSLTNDDASINERSYSACLNQDMVKTASVLFIWAAVPYRMTWRYSVRGYRYLFLDVGHVCQNLYLSAQDIDCGVCAIAAFDDDQLDTLLNLDGSNQFSVYVAALGKFKKDT